MHVTAKLRSLSNPPHRSHNLVAHNKRSNVASFTFGDKFLDQHVFPRTLQCLDNRFRHFFGLRKNHSDALSSFQ